MSGSVEVQLGGQQAHHKQHITRLTLEPKVRTVIPTDFSTLSYLAQTSRPDGTLGLHSTARGDTYLIEKGTWGNLWIYGMDVI